VTTVAVAVIVFVVVFLVATAAAAIWSGQLPLLRVLTGAKTVGPVGRPPYTATTETDSTFLDGDFPLPTPGALDPDTAADITDRHYRTTQQARHARHVSDLPHHSTPRRYP
jgi:hypothetical protein